MVHKAVIVWIYTVVRGGDDAASVSNKYFILAIQIAM